MAEQATGQAVDGAGQPGAGQPGAGQPSAPLAGQAVRRAILPGSFDPITRGHLDLVARAAALFDEVIVAVGTNTTKNYLLGLDERIALAQEAVAGLGGEASGAGRVRVIALEGLLVHLAARLGARTIVKGVRFGSDFDYELQQYQANNALSGVETVLLPAGREYGTVSSTILREIALNGGDIASFVTPAVDAAVRAAVARRTAA